MSYLASKSEIFLEYSEIISEQLPQLWSAQAATEILEYFDLSSSNSQTLTYKKVKKKKKANSHST